MMGIMMGSVGGEADMHIYRIFILEAVKEGKVPRVTRRLTGHERAMITPGTVWVWEEGKLVPSLMLGMMNMD